jgi:hypothetical protein
VLGKTEIQRCYDSGAPLCGGSVGVSLVFLDTRAFVEVRIMYGVGWLDIPLALWRFVRAI